MLSHVIVRPALFTALVTMLLPGCDTAECATAADCGATSAVCDDCPATAASMCLAGACASRGEDAVDVVANINITPRQLEVTSMVHVLAAMTSGAGPLTCDNAFDDDGRIAADVNVFSSGFKALSGGSYHPEVSVGRVPATEFAVLLVGTDGAAGSGTVVANGCVLGLNGTAAGTDRYTVDLMDLAER